MERVLFAPRELPPLRPDVAQDPDPYSEWVRTREADRVRAAPEVGSAHLLHLVMPIAGEPPPETVDTLRSLQAQTTEHWLLTALVQNQFHATFMSLLAVSGLQRAQRVRLDGVSGSGGAGGSGGSEPLCDVVRSGLEALAGSNVALIFPGDVWAPDAVAQLAARLVPAGVVYADEDTVTADRRRHTEPKLKPSYSPEFLLTSPYVGRPLAFGSLVLARLLGQDGAQTAALEHDMALRVCDAADAVVHLPEVLCHRLPTASAVHVVDDPRPVEESLRRRHEDAEVRTGPVPGSFVIRRSRRAERSVSIIIPFRDEPRMLRTCMDSIAATRGSSPMQCILVDNGSTQPETATLMEQLAERPDVLVLHDGRPFNWAELNNAAAAQASGDVLIFLNNDIEANRAGWTDVLCDQAMRPDIGVVGARLLYPTNRVQHCGVVLGLGGAAGHHLVGLPAEAPGYLNMAVLSRECAAVTGACFATRRDLFGRLGGFDESLGVDLNDIDYCLRAQRAGLRVLFDPDVELIHYESPSRGTAGDVKDIVRFVDRWRDSIVAGDPYLHPQLTRMDASCSLRAPHEVQWWQQWAASLEGAP